MKLSKLPYLW